MPQPKPIEHPMRATPAAVEHPTTATQNRPLNQSLNGRACSSPNRAQPGGACANTAWVPDGLFFSQLLIPQVGTAPEQEGFGSGQLSFAATSQPVPAQLIEELAQQLPAQASGPLGFTLLMPNLGEIQVNADWLGSRWNVQLGFKRRDVLARVQGHAQACRQALEDATGQAVTLHFCAVERA